MLGIKIDGPTLVHAETQSPVLVATNPSSTLKKNIVDFRFIKEKAFGLMSSVRPFHKGT